jgi:hypothetical protein
MEMTQSQLQQRFEHVIDGYVRGMVRGVCRYATDRETLITWMMEKCHDADLPEPVRRLLVAAHAAAIARDAYGPDDHDGIF